MKSTTIKRIVAFLFLTVGILYIVMWLQKSSYREGFQVIACPTKSIGGRNTFLCDSEDEAIMMLTTMTTPVPVCYNNSQYTDLSGSYVCYDTNGDPTFDDARGVYIPFDPISDYDPLPQSAEANIIAADKTFKSGYNSFMQAYTNAVSMERNVSTLGLANIKDVQEKLNVLSNAKCQNPTPVYSAPCAAISDALTKINIIVSDNSVNSLSNINRTLTDTRTTIKTALYNQFIPGFYTNIQTFMSSPQIVDYLANK